MIVLEVVLLLIGQWLKIWARETQGRGGPADSKNQRHIIRDRRPSTAACQLAGRWGQRNWNSVRWGKKYFVLGHLGQPRQNKNLLYRHDKPREPTKKGPLFFVLFKSPFTSVSTVSRGYPSLVETEVNVDSKSINAMCPSLVVQFVGREIFGMLWLTLSFHRIFSVIFLLVSLLTFFQLQR